MIGLWLVGRRFGGARLAAVLAFAWAAYPFTQYASNSNTNDAIMPCLLVYGFWLASSPVGRGVFGALSGWSKFASLIVVPLWATYPDRRPSARFLARVRRRDARRLLDRPPRAVARCTSCASSGIARSRGRSAAPRRSRSGTGGSTTRAALPDLHIVQRVLQALLVLGAIAFAWFPRRKSPLQLAALTAALLAGFELVQTYWLYTYIPWFFPFAAIAALAPAAFARAPVRSEEPDYRAWPFVAARAG